MSIFTNSNRITGDYELDATPGYEGSVGASQMFIESVQNDLALFEALITNDFREVSLLNESGAEEQVQALLEASAGGFVEKIKAFLKNAWEKIKGLVEAFISNLMNVVIRDNKKFVEKYRLDVIKKDLSKMKFKWSTLKANKDGVFGSDVTAASDAFDSLGKVTLSNVNDSFIEKVTQSSFKEEMYKDAFGQYVTGSELIKFAKEQEYSEKEVVDGLSDRLRDEIIDTLLNSNKILKGLKDIKSNIDKTYSKRLKEIDGYKNQVANSKDGESIELDGTKYGKGFTAGDLMKKLNALYKYCQVEQDFARDSISCGISVVKWKIKECRAVFARAAAFNAKLVKETDEDLMDAEDEAEEHELEEAFEGIYAY